MAKHLWTDVGEGDPVRVREMADEHAEARWVTAEIERLVDEGGQPRRDRGLLPDQRAVAGARGHARAGAGSATRSSAARSSTSGRRSRTRSQYLHVPGQPAGRDGVHADRELAATRHRADVAVARARATRTTMGSPSGTAARATSPAWRSAARKALERFMSTMERLKERADGDAPVAQLLDELLTETGYKEALEAERTIEAQGRLENLEELVRGRARVRHQRARRRNARRVPAADRAARGRGQASATTRAS